MTTSPRQEWARQTVVECISFSPPRHYMDVILGIFLKGIGIAGLWRQALALLAVDLVLFAAALASFRRNLS